MAKKLTLAGQQFTTRKQAIAFLRDNPEFVKGRLGNLVKGSRKLLADAGYQMKPGKGLSMNLVGPNGQTVWSGKKIPAPSPSPTKAGVDYTGIEDARSNPGRPTVPDAPKRGGGKRPPRSGQTAGPVGVDYSVPSPQVDLSGLAGAMGVDPNLFRGLNPNVGNLIPLKLAQQGARPMTQAQIDQLVSSLQSGTNTSLQLLSQQQTDARAQNAHNLDQISHWYDQVLQSQGVAAERDKAFGQAAVQSAQDAAQSVVSALGGEANLGAGMVGAAGQENVGNLQAISSIQDQFNADLAPLLQGEKAGQLTREQALGGQRLKDLQSQLLQMQAQKSSDEAQMRFGVWQSNNDILNSQIQNELAIRQANTNLRQQRFANQTGLRQGMIAAQAAQGDNVLKVAGMAQNEADRAASVAGKNADRAARVAIAQAQEAGRQARARLTKGGSKALPYARASSSTKDDAYNDILDVVEGKGLDPQQALQVAVAIAGGYGWSVKNPAVAAFIQSTLKAGGY